MNSCTSTLLPRLSALAAIAIAAFAFATTPLADHTTFASAFPIAQAQFAR